MRHFLGLDIGTTSTIGILITVPDIVKAVMSKPVTFSAPHPGWAEENPLEWWSNVCAIIPELLEKSGVAAAEIAGIGVTGMLPAVVLLDQKDELLRPSIQQSDGRCFQEVADLKSEIAETDYLKLAGNGINQQLVGCKMRWIEKNEPDVFAKVATVFGSYDFINFKLTGNKTIERNWALEAGLVDVSRHVVSDRLLELAHIAKGILPPKIDSHAIMGHVSKAASLATGLLEGTPVVGGAADFIASGLAAGLTKAGDVLLKFGGSADILMATEKVKPDARLFLDYHLLPDHYIPNGCMASGGSALNWFADKIASGEKANAAAAGLSIHQHLDQLAAKTPPGAEGVFVVPYFLGEKTPIHDPHARGTISGLSLNHGLEHIWRALLEGFGYAFRHHVEVLNEVGHTTINFLASDGGSNSKFWMQIVSDILQQPIQLLKNHPGSCLGAAWTAAIGVGASDDWQGAAKFVTHGDVIKPNKDLAALYDGGYKQFRQTYLAQVKLRNGAIP